MPLRRGRARSVGAVSLPREGTPPEVEELLDESQRDTQERAAEAWTLITEFTAHGGLTDPSNDSQALAQMACARGDEPESDAEASD